MSVSRWRGQCKQSRGWVSRICVGLEGEGGRQGVNQEGEEVVKACGAQLGPRGRGRMFLNEEGVWPVLLAQ